MPPQIMTNIRLIMPLQTKALNPLSSLPHKHLTQETKEKNLNIP